MRNYGIKGHFQMLLLLCSNSSAVRLAPIYTTQVLEGTYFSKGNYTFIVSLLMNIVYQINSTKWRNYRYIMIILGDLMIIVGTGVKGKMIQGRAVTVMGPEDQKTRKPHQ
jgi:hypothetical protein